MALLLPLVLVLSRVTEVESVATSEVLPSLFLSVMIDRQVSAITQISNPPSPKPCPSTLPLRQHGEAEEASVLEGVRGEGAVVGLRGETVLLASP